MILSKPHACDISNIGISFYLSMGVVKLCRLYNFIVKRMIFTISHSLCQACERICPHQIMMVLDGARETAFATAKSPESIVSCC